MWATHMVSGLQICNCALVSFCLEFLYKSKSDSSYDVSVNIWTLLSNISFANFGVIMWKTILLGQMFVQYCKVRFGHRI